LLWTVAVARHIFGPDMNLQAPPNLNADLLPALIAAGINDWGGVSPITPDHVNPESPWPHLGQLAEQTAAAGKRLTQRLTIYPQFALQAERWIHPALHASVLQHSDSEGYSREDAWVAGTAMKPPLRIQQIPAPAASRQLADILTRAEDGLTLTAAQIETLFAARGDDFASVCLAADAVRIEHSGNEVTYAVNRNINYTNLCVFKCRFCAFSKGKTSENLRGAPYVLDMDEISRRTEEAWSRGATEVCLQGGIHPAYTGHAYLDICRAVKDAAQDMHIHAFSPLEVMHGAQTLGKSIEAFLTELKAAGLESLPGTAAEILDDEIRRVICPDKLDTDGWFNIISTAHKIGLQTTGTIMFGHIEAPRHWAVHLLRLRTLQEQTGGITEFVPLPFIHMESPMYYRGHARRGPTYRETLLMHAIARLALNPVLNNIQTSWVKLGTEVAADCLNAGANDLGGTLMNESISRAAGADHGQELAPPLMDALIETLGRTPRQRTTLYNTPPAERINASYRARPLTAIHNQPAKSFKAAS
ncbi:MAG: 5-amino-6-(D-ribitylamino)uracil--L-tyrosine 4-hydroxyphenyl transferase CofH, partial [Gammaproteobacteria bacterium]|nr:5-amino-6-(D-ribitylamino)uracil--L-tyrosine 4-hydroxyphenyl transferase CofH [Gammaproteobacteria bacterium]